MQRLKQVVLTSVSSILGEYIKELEFFIKKDSYIQSRRCMSLFVRLVFGKYQFCASVV